MAFSGGENEEMKWRSMVFDEQVKIANNVGDVTDICSYEDLKSRLAVALFGIPEALVKSKQNDTLSYKLYPLDKQKVLETLAECIFTNQPKICKSRVYISFLFIFGRTMDKHPKNFQICVFRIPDGKGHFKFVDASERVYKDWEDFLTGNTLPEANICYPKDGIYKKRNAKVYFAKTPAAGTKHKVLKGTDIGSVVLGVASSICMGAALFVPIAAPVTLTSLVISSGSGIYGMGRAIESLVDRDQHRQSLSFSNLQARSAWLGAMLPIFGIAASGGCVFLSAASRAGMTLKNGTKVAINIANGFNCAAMGINLGYCMYSLVENRESPENVFQFIGSTLLFCNAIISTHQARMILKSGSQCNLFSFFSQPEIFENGMRVRYTNVINSQGLRFILRAISYNAAFFFNIPLDLCRKIDEIFFNLESIIKKRTSPFTFLLELLPHLRNIWSIIINISEENVHCKNDKWERARRYYADIPGSSQFEVLQILTYLKNVSGEKMKQEKKNDYESEEKNDYEGEENTDFSKQIMKYFEEPKLLEVLEQYKKLDAQSFVYFRVYSTEGAEMLYFAYPKECHIVYDKLVFDVIDKSHSYNISESKNSCLIEFSDPTSKYTMALVSVHESHRGFILLKYR